MRLTFPPYLAVGLLVLGTLSACVTTVIPPKSPVDPVEVFIVDHGRTTSLVIPSSEGEALRYAYGDWNWYALGHKDVYHGIAALLWPTGSGLGRADLRGSTAAEISTQVHVVEALHVVQVDRERVRAFEKNMEGLYDTGREREVENREADLSFVPHPRPYSYFWNSNHAVASWLRELGCHTRGASFRARWRVIPDSGG
jgi:hypothetical protein